MRRLKAITLLTLAACVAVACAADAATAPAAGIEGRYILRSLDGSSIPTGRNASIEADTLTLTAGAWTEKRVAGFTDGRRLALPSAGKYTVNGSQITLVGGDSLSTSWVGKVGLDSLTLTNCNTPKGCGVSEGSVYVYTK